MLRTTIQQKPPEAETYLESAAGAKSKRAVINQSKVILHVALRGYGGSRLVGLVLVGALPLNS